MHYLAPPFKQGHAHMQKHSTFSLAIFALILLMSGLLFNLLLPQRVFASVQAKSQAILRSTTCQAQITPDEHSLLIILLDRSGSMGLAGPTVGGTDPYNNSASVTDALADLWIGPMAVVIFSGDSAQTLSSPDHTQRKDLKAQIDASTASGYTPMDLAFQKAQTLLQQQGYPAGSRIVLITDGFPQTASDPQGNLHEQPDILNNLTPQLHKECVPLYAFGLAAGYTDTQTRNSAQHFLTQATTNADGTPNGFYYNVPDTTTLANAVLALYAQWRGLEFHKIDEDTVNNDYQLALDSSFQEASIITFHSGDFTGQNKPLATKSGQNIASQEVTISTGNHDKYEIDTLQPPIAPDTYIVDTGGDTQALVFTLVKSTRTLQIVKPTRTNKAYTGGSVTIWVHLLDQGTAFVPAANEQKIFQATVIETVHGKQLPPQTVPLTQQQAGSDIFAGTYAVPVDTQPEKTAVTIGTLEISGYSKYQGIVHTTQASVIIPVVIPALVIPPVPPKPCPATCVIQRNLLWLIVLAAVLLLGLIALICYIRWRNASKPYGYLVSAMNDDSAVPLGTYRPFWSNCLHPSQITMKELASYPNGLTVTGSLLSEPLAISFTEQGIFLKLMQGTSSNVTVVTEGEEMQFSATRRTIQLKEDSEIRCGGFPVANYRTIVAIAFNTYSSL